MTPEEFIEVSNDKSVEILYLSNADHDKLEIVYGENKSGMFVHKNVVDIPHMLISGTTGTGKTSYVQSLLAGLIINHPYKGLCILVYDSTGFNYPTGSTSITVENDVERFKEVLHKVQDTADYRVETLKKDPTVRFSDIIVVMDDVALLTYDDTINSMLTELLRIGRTTRIHCWFVTSTPNAEFVSSEFRTNITHRVAFFTTTKRVSMMILDEEGAERLGKNEFIFKGNNKTQKLDAIYIEGFSDICISIDTNYGTGVLVEQPQQQMLGMTSADPLYEDVKKFIATTGKASTASIQRYFGFGYNRAARILDYLEQEGAIGPANGSMPREVYITADDVVKDIALAQPQRNENNSKGNNSIVKILLILLIAVIVIGYIITH